MKANIIILMLVLTRCNCGHAQIQELEQLKLNLEKLVQLKLMLSQARQGYQTLQNGYNAVRDVARGNYNLHKNYLDGLLQVNAPVRNAPALKRFTDNGAIIQKEYRAWYMQLQKLNVFSRQEMEVTKENYQKIRDEYSECIEQLQMILGAGKLRMDDGERIAAIEVLAGKSDNQVTALLQLVKDQTVIAAARAQDKKDLEAIRRLYGVH